MFTRTITTSALLLVLGLTGGCASPPYRPQLAGAKSDGPAKTLDDLKWFVDAYGSASISSPLLVRPDEAFKFNLSKVNADTFFEAEKSEVSGRAAGTFESAQVTGTSVALSADVAAMMSYMSALSAFRQNSAIISQKKQLLNDAAILQYRAAVESARALTDPGQRAQALADARIKLEQSLAGPAADATLTPPEAPAAPPLPTLPDSSTIPNAASALLPGAFANPQGLFATGTPGVTGAVRSALLLAAGDTATNAILSLLGDPLKMTRFKGKRVLFGVSMVSVNPGWKTRSGYAADVAVRLRFKAQPARPAVRESFLKPLPAGGKMSAIDRAALEQLQTCVATSLHESYDVKDLDDPQKTNNAGPYSGAHFEPFIYTTREDRHREPLVAAVSPMSDAQALDLQSSSRRRSDTALQVALALSYAGLHAEAKSFANFAMRQQRDIETRSHNVVVNAYSNADGGFGFRLYPSVEANPTPSADQPVNRKVLKPWAFPTLIIVASDDEHLRPRVYVRTQPGAPPQCFLVEQSLQFSETSNWAPLDEDPCQPTRDAGERCKGDILFTEEERFRLKQAMHAAKNDPGASGYLKQRLDQLDDLLNGASHRVDLPADLLTPVVDEPQPRPAAKAISPERITLEVGDDGAVTPHRETVLITGDDLDQVNLDKIEIATGKAQIVRDPGHKPELTGNGNGKSLRIEILVTDDEPISFKLPSSRDASAFIFSRPILVKKPGSLKITTTTVVDPKTKDKTETLQFTRGTPADVVKSQVEKNKTPEKK